VVTAPKLVVRTQQVGVQHGAVDSARPPIMGWWIGGSKKEGER
jgi:hypothetical protein